jgi:PAS domain S-box-containing protein
MSTLSEIDSQTSRTIKGMKTDMYSRMTTTSSIIYIISAFVLVVSIAGWIFIRKIGWQMERTANDALLARAELQRSHDELEMRVQERTGDLQKTNEQLQREITVRETAEEELKASEEQFRSYFELGNIGMAIISREKEWLRINDYICTLLGYSKEELMNLTWADITYPEDLDLDMLNFNDMLSGKTDTYQTDKRFMKKNGDIIFANITMACQRNPDSSVNYFITSVQDITERMKVEAALQKERDRAQVYLNIAGVMIVVLDADGSVALINQKGCEILGYDEEYIVGKNWLHNFLPERIKDEVSQVFQKLMAGNIEPLKYYENPVLTKINEERMIAFHNTLIENRSGNVTGILFSGEDITERKKLEEQLLQAQKMEAVGQLAGGVAHDFNNILTAIISYSHLLKNRLKEDDRARDNIEKILSLSNRATSITRDLLTFSRKQYFEFTPAKLNEIIRNVEKLLAKFIPEDIALKTIFAEEDLSIIADTTQIEQVIMNLVTNARDAMPEGGELIIETKLVHIDDNFIKLHGFGQAGRYALLSVSDTGSGFEEEIRQKIFEPFFTTKEVGKGSGLGLAIVYGIIKQHNGYINVYSEPDKGTTVKIYLPEIKSEFKGEKEEVLPDLTGKGETILVAEDEASVMDSMKSILHEFGYKVIEAVDGLDAVEKFKQHNDNIQLVILDVVMPRMNGKETYDEIRKIRPEIKVLFTSGYTADIIEQKRVLRDDFVFISKPILPDKLLSKIREELEG